MKKTFLRTVVTLLVGWLLYSMTGTIPIYMAFPLPDFMHTNQTSLPDGYTDENKLKYDIDRKIIAAGTFEKLGVFDNGNYLQNAFYDRKKDAYTIYSENCTYRLPVDNPSDDEIISTHPHGVAIHVGNYEYLPKSSHVATRRGTLMELDGFMGASINKGTSLSLDDTTLLIEAQQTEKITVRQLSALLYLRYSGMLVGWFPEEKAVVFNRGEGNYAVVTYGNVVSEKYDNAGETMNKFYYYENIHLLYAHAVSADKLIGYDKDKQAIVQYTFSTGESTVLVANIPELAVLNISLANDETFLGGFLDPSTAFIYNCATEEFTKFDLKDDFRGDQFVFGDDEFLLVMHLDDGGFRWKNGTYYFEEEAK